MGIQSSENAQHLSGQPAKIRNVANIAGGGLPEKGASYNAQVIRTTWEGTAIAEGGRPSHNGLISSRGVADSRPTGTFTVDDNDFSTGIAVILIGDYEFVQGVDYQVGALAANTATNIAAALNAIPGWTAAAVGADVTFRYPHPGRVRFLVRHFGTIENFTPLVPATGICAYGSTNPDPPTLT